MTDILIVEDEANLRLYFAAAAEKIGLTVATAANGMEALQAAELAWPRAVLLDWTLPGGLDGRDVWDRLSQMADGRPLRVIVCTAIRESSIQGDIDARRAAAVLDKPVLALKLINAYRTVLTE
jgi:CheY-like chemotaxis protein